MKDKLTAGLRDLLKAVDDANNDEIIRIGKKILKHKDCPTGVLNAVGMAYLRKALGKDDKKLASTGIRYMERAEETREIKDVNELILMSRSYSMLDKFVKALPVTQRAIKAIDALPDDKKPSVQFRMDLYMTLGRAAGNLGNSLLAVDAYDECFRLVTNLRRKVHVFSDLLLRSQTLEFSSKDVFDLSCSFEKIFDGVERYTHDLSTITEEIRSTGRKIRIGYVSPDFCNHVVLSFIYGLLMEYDKDHFEVFCYDTLGRNDEATELIKKAVDHFIPVCEDPDWTFADIAKIIHEDRIDILVDLAGHTAYSGLAAMAYKPAPIQISGIGYLGTTGLSAVDYFITDKIVDPPGMHEKYLVEKPLYLTSHFCYKNMHKAPIPEGAPCLKNGFVQFASFNQYLKLTDEMLLAWGEILNRVEGSKLLLKSNIYKDEDVIDLATERFRRLGLPIERITIECADGRYMYRYADVDIALDTYPYTGGGTTCSALVMGVPVVTMYGERRNTRFSYGILNSLNLPYLAVTNLREYVEMVVTLAQDKQLLEDLHRQIPVRFYTHFVGQPKLYVAEMEDRYREILGVKQLTMA